MGKCSFRFVGGGETILHCNPMYPAAPVSRIIRLATTSSKEACGSSGRLMVIRWSSYDPSVGGLYHGTVKLTSAISELVSEDEGASPPAASSTPACTAENVRRSSRAARVLASTSSPGGGRGYLTGPRKSSATASPIWSLSVPRSAVNKTAVGSRIRIEDRWRPYPGCVARDLAARTVLAPLESVGIRS